MLNIAQQLPLMKLFVKLQRVRSEIFLNWKFSVKSQQYEGLSLVYYIVALFQARLLDFIENLLRVKENERMLEDPTWQMPFELMSMHSMLFRSHSR